MIWTYDKNENLWSKIETLSSIIPWQNIYLKLGTLKNPPYDTPLSFNCNIIEDDVKHKMKSYSIIKPRVGT